MRMYALNSRAVAVLGRGAHRQLARRQWPAMGVGQALDVEGLAAGEPSVSALSPA
jgi:hypothetical protein